MHVSELATTPAITCHPEASIETVARLMTEHEVGAVIVVDDRAHPVGIVTDRDLGLRTLTRALPPTAPASSVMSRDVVRIDEAADVEAAKSLMASRGYAGSRS
jgi:CBS domain-containing protein